MMTRTRKLRGDPQGRTYRGLSDEDGRDPVPVPLEHAAGHGAGIAAGETDGRKARFGWKEAHLMLCPDRLRSLVTGETEAGSAGEQSVEE
jgi:hypothetical protein